MRARPVIEGFVNSRPRHAACGAVGRFSTPPGDRLSACRKAMVGQGGLEPPTPRLSSVCSNQLSYWPDPFGPIPSDPARHPAKQVGGFPGKRRSINPMDRQSWMRGWRQNRVSPISMPPASADLRMSMDVAGSLRPTPVPSGTDTPQDVPEYQNRQAGPITRSRSS